MTISTGPRIGRFYKFKPRSKWPLDAQQTLPSSKSDELYYIHPVIVLSTTATGMLTVITTTSHPRLQHGINAYIPIGFQSPLLHSEPLVMNRTLPKASYVCLDSRRTFSMELLIPFWSEGNGGQFELENESKDRLVKVVDEFEAGTYGRDLPLPLIQWMPKMDAPAVAFTKPSKKRKKKKAKKNAAVTPPAPSKKAKKAKSAGIQAVSTIAATSQSGGREEKPMDILEIKTSLSGLKLAVAALEALCEKLESNAPIVSTTEIAPSVGAADALLMSGALRAPAKTPVSKDVPAVMTSEVDEVKDDDYAASGVSESTRSSKRYRIEKWFSKLWKKRTGLSLSSI